MATARPRRPPPVGRPKPAAGEPGSAAELQQLILSHIDEIVYAVGSLGHTLMTGQIEFISERVRHILGFEPTDLLGDVNRWFALVHPGDQAAVLDATREIFRTGEPGTRLYRLQDQRSGEWRWIEDTVVPLRDAQDRVRRQFGVLRDVTERVRSDEVVRESERRHRELIENSQGIILTLRLDGTIQSVNPAVERSLGYAAGAVVGRPLTQFVPVRSREAVAGALLEIGPARTSEGLLPILAASGEERTWAFRAILIEAAGREPYVLANGVDVSDLKRAESALRQSEAQYRALVEEATVGIYRSTPAGRFLAANRTMVEMLGYDSLEQVLGLDIATDVYVDPAERERLLAEIAVRPLSGVETDWKRRGGEVIRVRVSGRPVFDSEGRVQSFEMVAEDVTRARQLASQLRQAQKMEAVGQLTSGIAHDFNNLLTAILANIDLAVGSCPPELEEVRADLAEASKAAQHAAQMIRKLMAFGRREQLELETVDVGALMAETARMLRRLLPESIDVRVVSDGRPALVRADRGALEQIVLNLATNSRDAMPHGGTLTIETRTAEIDENSGGAAAFGARGPHAVIAVHDTGTGIPEDMRSRVFEPFFTTKPQGVGTGLGLAMVYGLVKQHRGYITLDSVPGRTSLTIVLPRVAPEPAPLEREVQPAVARGTETVLLVEDDAGLRRTAARTLERAGYTVISARDGEEALTMLEEGHVLPDLVVTDIVMPKRSGVSLYEASRRLAGPPRFLFTSGYAGDQRAGGALDPALPFLRKPWTTGELTRMVRRALDAR